MMGRNLRTCVGGCLRACAVLAVVVLWSTPLGAELHGRAPAKPTAVNAPDALFTIDNQRRIDINQINMWVTNYGSFAWDLATGNSGLVYPRGTDRTAVFASGLWLGARVGLPPGNERTVVAEYSQEYGPGTMVGGTFDDPNRPEYRVYKVVRWTGDPSDTTRVNRSAEDLAADPLADPLVHHSWSEYIAGAKPYGAPTRMWDLPDPNNPGMTVQVEGPDVLGDQMLWSVYNDADASRHTNDAGGSTPLGIEVQQSTFGFNRQGALGLTVFVRFQFINKGANQLDSMFVSLWSDPDLGGFTDDLVGCDTTLSLGYVYNANNADQIYGASPPAVGYDFFLGPTNALGDTLPLTSFNKYINGTDPSSTDETYNYMRGLMPDGSPVVDPDGQTTVFFHAGDPVQGTGWLDSNPADRRFMMTAGPFSMAPGDTQVVVGAILIGQGNDRLSSISALKFNDTFAQDAFDRGFILPSPPAQPKVDVARSPGTVTLSWDNASRDNYTQAGYAFEGYNIYQGESVAGPWKLIATYDEINSVRVIYDEVFDVETGQLIPQYPVAFGSDVGVRYRHTITQDAVRGGPLNDATEYYFAVTSYSYGPSETPKVLENPQAVIRVTPQSYPAGTDPSTASATPVTQSLVDTAKPPATDQVVVTVVNPSLVTGDDYRVTFTPLSMPYPQIVIGADTLDILHSWNLINATTGDTLLKNQLNRTGDEDYQVVDGLLVKVIGSYAPAFQAANYLNNNPANRRALTGVNWGGSAFFGGAGTGWEFWGGTLDPSAMPDSFTTVEVQFDSANPQMAYRYLRYEDGTGAAPALGRAYAYGGFHPVNFQVWDVINDVQLDAAFVERTVTDALGTIQDPGSQVATFDSTWAPDASGVGGREYLFLLRTPYSDTPKAQYTSDGAMDNSPILFNLWAHLRAASDVIDDGDAFEFVWANPATENNIYDFSTSALARNNAALASSRMSSIRVVPNPYYNRSLYELNQFNRKVRFTNLPETCTIRIFNLSGSLIRTLRKTDVTSSIFEWDLQTENALPVGSGIYIFHVEAPGVGSMFGRMAVFMETERLNNY